MARKEAELIWSPADQSYFPGGAVPKCVLRDQGPALRVLNSDSWVAAPQLWDWTFQCTTDPGMTPCPHQVIS